MKQIRINFQKDELISVLSHYDIGNVYSTAALNAGNQKAPKCIVTSDMGKFMLKRRASEKNDLYRVRFAHSIQNYLSRQGFPVANLVKTKDGKSTILNLKNNIYELFEYIQGQRYNQSQQATLNSGIQLGYFHKFVSDYEKDFSTLKETYHDSAAVRGHLKIILKNKPGNDRINMAKCSKALTTLYNFSSTNVNQLGFENWPQQIIHGDWHPGNMLFDNDNVIAILDFDSVKIAPLISDLANAILHFSIVGGRPNPADWPDYLNIENVQTFMQGYQSQITLTDKMLSAIPDLMIEALISEAVLPVAATGSFGNLCGVEFLKMILKKCVWIDNNRKSIKAKIFG